MEHTGSKDVSLPVKIRSNGWSESAQLRTSLQRVPSLYSTGRTDSPLLSVIIIIFSVDLIFKLLFIRFTDLYFVGAVMTFSPTNGDFSLDMLWVFFIIKEINGIF